MLHSATLHFWWGPEHIPSAVHGLMEAPRHRHGEALHNNPGAMSDPSPHTACLILTALVGSDPSTACSLSRKVPDPWGCPGPPQMPRSWLGWWDEAWLPGPALLPWGAHSHVGSFASGPFLNLVVPLSILKIHSFPAAMVKHKVFCKATPSNRRRSSVACVTHPLSSAWKYYSFK